MVCNERMVTIMKKLCSTILCVAMLLSLLSISGYAASVNSERNILYDNIVSSVSPNVEMEVLEEIPDGIVPLSFDSSEDAVRKMPFNLSTLSEASSHMVKPQNFIHLFQTKTMLQKVMLVRSHIMQLHLELEAKHSI